MQREQIHTISEIDSASCLNGKRRWQVFFFPKEDVTSPHSFVAFCPYTKVWAEGKDIAEAARNWINQARKRLNCGFYIPKASQKWRKVWYGESQSMNGDPVFIVDVHSASADSPFSSQEDSAVAFCPQTGQLLCGKLSDWRELTSDELGDHLKLLPSLWMDWKVLCTPLLTCGGESEEPIRTSLTPHCIN